MKKTLLYILLFTCHAAFAQADSRAGLIVPAGGCRIVMTDGQIEKEEWQGSLVIPIGDSASILWRQSDEYIFLAIKIPFRLVAYVDVYFDYGENYIHNLHSSSQIGERKLYDTGWDAHPFHWGNSDGWYANEHRFDRIKAQELLKENPNRDRTLMQLETYFPYDGFEYILKKTKFPWKRLKLRVDVRTSMPGYHDIIYPENSDLKISDRWQTIVLKQ